MKKEQHFKFAFILALFLSVTTLNNVVSAQTVKATPAPKGSWQHLGTATVSYGVDKDVIKVSGADAFRKLKFMVHDAKLEIYDMDVFLKMVNTRISRSDQ